MKSFTGNVLDLPRSIKLKSTQGPQKLEKMFYRSQIEEKWLCGSLFKEEGSQDFMVKYDGISLLRK